MSGAIYPSLQGKKVLITGGGSGIGAGLVTGFALQGSEVHFIDLADSISAELANNDKIKITPKFYECDLTNSEKLQATLESIGDIDILLNNAASDDRHTLADVTPEYIDNRLAVNLKHLILCAKHAAAGMKKRGGGAIINFGSISWHLGLEDLVLYETAKAGIEGMTRALARELGIDNIRVTCIVPGNVKTPRQMKWYTPEGEAEIVKAQCLKGRLEPSHIASMAMFLASDDASLCTGHEYWIDAGWR